MKAKKLLLLILTGILAIAIISCSGSKNATAADPAKSTDGLLSSVSPMNSRLPLLDYLKKVPGVQVVGSGSSAQVVVQENATPNQENQAPLFIIDEMPMGTDFSAVEDLLDAQDIDKVTILKNASATSAYGTEGANGVIVIKTKKS